MLDTIILYLLLNYDIYEKYHNIINMDQLKENNRELHVLFSLLRKVHNRHQKDLSVDDFRLIFFSTYTNLKPEGVEIFNDIFDKMSEMVIDDTTAIESLERYRQRSNAFAVTQKALAVFEGKEEYDSLVDLVKSTSEVTETRDEVEFVSSDLQSLLDTVSNTPGLRWRLKLLNESIGSLRKGNFGFLFARPETGKTTILASEVSFMAEQIGEDETILWFNNEEVGSKVALRIYQAVFGVEQRTLANNLDQYTEQYHRRIGDRIKVIDNASMTFRQAERIVSKLNPRLIVFDQIDKIKGFDGEGVQLFGKIYIWARELAKKYCPVIGVCQASADGEGELYLEQGHVDQSKTAKAAEADFMFGVGRDPSRPEYIRGISICKNKLGTDAECIEAMRHAKKTVIIVPQHARYQDIS